MRVTKKKVGALFAGIAIVLGAGLAYAFWTTGGSGTGTASTGDSSAFEITPTGTAPSGLYPDGPAQDISFIVHNTANHAQRLEHVSLAVTGFGVGNDAEAQAVASQPPCTTDDFAVTNPTVTAGDLAADDASAGGLDETTVTGTVQLVNNTLANQDNCKNVTVNVSATSDLIPAP